MSTRRSLSTPMKFLSVLLAAAALTVPVNAQYFSEGWKPGQPVVREAPSTATFIPQAVLTAKSVNSDGNIGPSPFNLTNFLTTGPVASIASKLGVNMTERLERARRELEMWDPRIPLITDNNYWSLIVNETMTPDEEVERVWFLIVTVSAGGNSAFSRMADDYFDSAFNKSVVENDLPNVRWGRIDYLNVTYLTTKWSIWQAPFLVVLKDRGETLRFYKANSVRLDPDIIHRFLKEEGWRESEPWTGPFAPGGSQETFMHYYAIALKAVYDLFVRIPRWLLMIISGGVAQFVMKWMHRNAGTDASRPEPSVKPASKPIPAAGTVAHSSSASTQVNGTGATPAKGKGKQRKNAKK
ncbi:hypothetical protein AcV5_001137 [Taiwanofungus camphoratus]|nr:hypothetical protein AcV5_001137 [Antrodia cinnamomea]